MEEFNIDPGEMRRRIRFLRFDGTRDEAGEPMTYDREHWIPVGRPVWAKVDTSLGREFFVGQQSQSQVPHKIICRYRPGITSAMRILYGTRVLEIESAVDWKEQGRYLLIMAKEAVE